MANLNEFIAYLEQEVANHSIYVIGAQGQRGSAVTEKFIRNRESASKTNADRAVNFWKKQVEAGFGDVLGAFDCSGLGMYYLYNLKGIHTADLTAQGMYSVLCSAHPAKIDLKRGDWAFKRDSSTNRITHVGYIVDDNLNVIECRGRDYGVVKGALDNRWTDFGRPDCFKADIEGTETPGQLPEDFYPVIRQNLKSGMEGSDVKSLQIILAEKGYNINADGKFGTNTKQAVMEFQQSVSLKADGVAGKDTVTSLGLIWGKDLTDAQIVRELYEKSIKIESEYIEKLNNATTINLELSQIVATTKAQLTKAVNEAKSQADSDVSQYKAKLLAAESTCTLLNAQCNSYKADMAKIKAITDKY